jgi:hypothetical protein
MLVRMENGILVTVQVSGVGESRGIKAALTGDP